MPVKDFDKKIKALVGNNKVEWLNEFEQLEKDEIWRSDSRKVALKVNRYKRENGLKGKDLAKMLNVSEQRMSKILKGHENFTIKTIKEMERAFGIEIMYFEKPKPSIQIYVQFKFENTNKPKEGNCDYEDLSETEGISFSDSVKYTSKQTYN